MDPFAGISGGSSEVKGKALYAYSAQAANQVSFAAGEEIIILTNGGAGGWSKGQNTAGKFAYSCYTRM